MGWSRGSLLLPCARASLPAQAHGGAGVGDEDFFEAGLGFVEDGAAEFADGLFTGVLLAVGDDGPFAVELVGGEGAGDGAGWRGRVEFDDEADVAR